MKPSKSSDIQLIWSLVNALKAQKYRNDYIIEIITVVLNELKKEVARYGK